MTQANEDYFDLLGVIAILRRQLRLVLLITVVIVAIAFVYVVRATPLYTSTALVRVDPQETNLLDPTIRGSANSGVESTRIETEVEILKSSSLALQTISSGNLQTSVEFGSQVSRLDSFKTALGIDLPAPPSGDALLNATLEKFSKSLTVRRRGQTYLIAIQVTTPDPRQSANVANDHARTYISDQVSDRVASSIAARDILQSQLNQARQRLAQSNESLQVYIGDNIDRLIAETGSEELAFLAAGLGKASLQMDSSLNSLEAARLAVVKNDWSALASSVGDSAIRALEQERLTLRNHLQAEAAESVQAIDLTEGLAQIERQLQLRSQSVVSRLQQDVASYRDSRQTLLDDMQNQVLQSELSAGTLADIYELQQEAQIAQRQYDQLIGRMRDVETQAVLQMANSRIVSEAIPAVNLSYPNKKIVLVLAIVAAAGVGIGAALLKEFYFGGVTAASQLANIIPAKVGAVIPKIGSSGGGKSVADKVVNEPMSQFAEAFRKLRASVDQTCGAATDRGRVILVTSAIPAEGKSTTALSLARTYALAGKKTLLIDADLRNPSIHGFIGENPEYGLMDFLMSEEQAENASAKSGDATGEGATPELVDEFYGVDPLSNLGIILGSRRANTPTDAPLQTDAFLEMIAETRGAFDVVVIDTAPLLPVVDTQYIAPLVDAAVICVRFGEANQAELRTASTLLGDTLATDAQTVTVLNCFEGIKQSYRYDGYYG